jgi:hypothetical protein
MYQGQNVDIGTPSAGTVGTAQMSSAELELSGGLGLGDNVKAQFGAGNDLQIYSDGADSFIKESGTGEFAILASNFKLQDTSGNNYISMIAGGEVMLKHNGTTKLATTSTGIDVTGSVTADGLTNNGDVVLSKSATGVPILKMSGFAAAANNPYSIINFYNEDGSQAGPNNSAAIKALVVAADGSGGQLAFYTAPSNAAEGADATERLRIDSSGKVGIGTSSPSFENGSGVNIHNSSGIGSHLKLTDSTTGVGGSNGLDIYSWGTSAYIENYESGSLVFRNAASERMRIQSGGGISFNGDTAAANALDDYEEGTYQYTITGNTSGSMTPRSTYSYFAYTKIGRKVTVQGKFETSGTHNAVGYLKFSLPFTVGNLTETSDHAAGSLYLYRTGFANIYNPTPVVSSGNSHWLIYYNLVSNNEVDYLEGGDVDSSIEGYLSITYFTA